MSYDLEANLKVPGWMSEAELRWLYEQATRMKSIVEIGSWKGRSTFALASGLLDGDYENPVLFPVDTWAGSFVNGRRLAAFEDLEGGRDVYGQDFLPNVGHFPCLDLKYAGLSSMAAANKRQGLPKVGMVFIDGGHEYPEVMKDLEAWEPLACRLLCGHDYHTNWPGVILAVEKFFKGKVSVAPGTSIWYVDLDGLMMEPPRVGPLAPTSIARLDLAKFEN
jgi:hypothetical protein